MCITFSTVLQPLTTRCHASGLGSCAFARRYLRNHWIIFFSSGYLDVSVPRVRLCIRRCRNRFRRVAPFGNPRITEYLPLRVAYRSLSRPSSPPRAKASFMRPSLLSFNVRRTYFHTEVSDLFCRTPLVIACSVSYLVLQYRFRGNALRSFCFARFSICFQHVNVLSFLSSPWQS